MDLEVDGRALFCGVFETCCRRARHGLNERGSEESSAVLSDIRPRVVCSMLVTPRVVAPVIGDCRSEVDLLFWEVTLKVRLL